MAQILVFHDTVKADSERDAVMQIYRLYPSAIDIELEFRERADGTPSSSGKFFVFRIELEQGGDYDLAPEELGEDEY